MFLAGTFFNLTRKLKIFGEEVHTATLFGFDLSQRVSLGKKTASKTFCILSYNTFFDNEINFVRESAAAAAQYLLKTAAVMLQWNHFIK